MKKKRLEFDRKLVLNKAIVSQLGQREQRAIAGGDSTPDASCGAANCVTKVNTIIGATCVYCDPTNAVQLTCRPQLCGLENTAVSCQAGPGCAKV